MTTSPENQDETAYLLGNEANARHLRESLRQFEAGEVVQFSGRRTLLEKSFSRAKRAAEATIARNAHRLKTARMEWQKATDEGR